MLSFVNLNRKNRMQLTSYQKSTATLLMVVMTMDDGKKRKKKPEKKTGPSYVPQQPCLPRNKESRGMHTAHPPAHTTALNPCVHS